MTTMDPSLPVKHMLLMGLHTNSVHLPGDSGILSIVIIPRLQEGVYNCYSNISEMCLEIISLETLTKTATKATPILMWRVLLYV